MKKFNEELSMKKLAFVVALVAFFLFEPQSGFSQFNEEIKGIKKEIKAMEEEINGLKESLKGIQKELQEIKTLLRPRQALPEFKEAILRIDGNFFKGDKDAPLIVVEFSEYQ
jgi:septal ring factor EnvC (AmiA/AmiB activator)